jgi:hypothetical protein
MRQVCYSRVHAPPLGQAPAEAACNACAVQSTHKDAESKAQLKWACRQPPLCPASWDIEWEIF